MSKLHVISDDPYIPLGKLKFRIAYIVQGIAVFLAAIFFLPLFRVSCEGMEVTFTGLNALLGQTVDTILGERKLDGNWTAVFLLIIPVVLFLVIQFKRNLSFLRGKVFILSTVLSLLGIGSFLLLAYTVGQQAEANSMTAEYTAWFYCSIGLYAGAGVVSLLSILVGAVQGKRALQAEEEAKRLAREQAALRKQQKKKKS